ncbi:DUF4351 domain-containing protein [Geminocystis herdmanii]|uniref:DUF4351 domain-containing protein n=1 Tax=Geminocystis herdmanii TaxID=669359 RepID=UPI0003457F74|nr:DUF4351 domain-containing protein [Geminocystis herdmanii]
MTEINANYDEPWKEAIGDYFDRFLDFFFPEVYNLIDWLKPVTSLDKELQKITADSDDSKRLVDKLFQVCLKDKQEVWILVHIEVQSQYDTDFNQRMFIYHYRSFDLYRKPVISLAILGDEKEKWRPSNYGYDLGGCKLKLDFPTIKLLDYQKKWAELEINLNPFAMMIMAHLKTKATTSNLTEREQWKWYLIRSLYDKKYSKLEIVKLFKFIDSMMTLPPLLQQSLNQKVIKYEEEKVMPLVSPFERMAEERGLEKGLQEGLQQRIDRDKELIIRLIHRKLGVINEDLQTQVKALNIDDLETLAEDLFDMDSVENLQQWLSKF